MVSMDESETSEHETMSYVQGFLATAALPPGFNGRRSPRKSAASRPGVFNRLNIPGAGKELRKI